MFYCTLALLLPLVRLSILDPHSTVLAVEEQCDLPKALNTDPKVIWFGIKMPRYPRCLGLFGWTETQMPQGLDHCHVYHLLVKFSEFNCGNAIEQQQTTKTQQNKMVQHILHIYYDLRLKVGYNSQKCKQNGTTNKFNKVQNLKYIFILCSLLNILKVQDL